MATRRTVVVQLLLFWCLVHSKSQLFAQRVLTFHTLISGRAFSIRWSTWWMYILIPWAIHSNVTFSLIQFSFLPIYALSRLDGVKNLFEWYLHLFDFFRVPCNYLVWRLFLRQYVNHGFEESLAIFFHLEADQEALDFSIGCYSLV